MNEIKTPDNLSKPVDQALDEWYELAKPLCELGFEIHSFDPGISFRSKECKGHQAIFAISCSDLKIINDAIKR